MAAFAAYSDALFLSLLKNMYDKDEYILVDGDKKAQTHSKLWQSSEAAVAADHQVSARWRRLWAHYAAVATGVAQIVHQLHNEATPPAQRMLVTSVSTPCGRGHRGGTAERAPAPLWSDASSEGGACCSSSSDSAACFVLCVLDPPCALCAVLVVAAAVGGGMGVAEEGGARWLGRCGMMAERGCVRALGMVVLVGEG